MPKKILATKDTILEATRVLIDNKEYDKLNCRDIARKCDIAVGTLYHFFASKMEILALIILEDWRSQIASIKLDVAPLEGIKNIYQGIYDFSLKYNDLWTYTIKNSTDFSMTSLDRHSLLLKQISNLVDSLSKYNNILLDENEVEFLSEAILLHATKLNSFEKYEKIFIKIIGGNR